VKLAIQIVLSEQTMMLIFELPVTFLNFYTMLFDILAEIIRLLLLMRVALSDLIEIQTVRLDRPLLQIELLVMDTLALYIITNVLIRVPLLILIQPMYALLCDY
jgi:hypothetical protein